MFHFPEHRIGILISRTICILFQILYLGYVSFSLTQDRNTDPVHEHSHIWYSTHGCVISTVPESSPGPSECTGGSNKKGTKTDDILKNIVYVELYNVDMGDWYGLHHILTKIEWEIFWKYFWPLEFKNLNSKLWPLENQKNNGSIKIKMVEKNSRKLYII